MTTIDAPRTPSRPARKGGVNWEKWGWIYMRASGLVLIILIDFWSKGAKYQRVMFWIVIVLWVILLAGFLPRHLMHVFGGA